MRSLAVWVSSPYKNDEIFHKTSPYNRDNCLASFHLLRDKLVQNGARCHTHDFYLNEGSTPDVVLFLDIPCTNLEKLLGHWYKHIRKWLLIQESQFIIPRNWNLKLHEQYDKIFTWNDDFVDNMKYFKLNWTHAFPASISYDLSCKSKLCVLIAGNKSANCDLELYSKRIEAIRWFERNHPEDFDLYGVGWDEYTFNGPRLVRALNYCKPLKKIFAQRYSSYRGTILRKHDVLMKYKYCICYENFRDIPGYITEKIFDCFFAGCVPIYWGASNVRDHIPDDCFIDRNNYASYEELYDYLVTISDAVYTRYLDSIAAYLASPMAYEFTVESFANTLTRELISE